MPVVASTLIYILEKKGSFAKLNYKAKQVLIGIVFGLLAIAGTEWGIALGDAQTNCRDASVLTAGLMFGGPAGIIAGFIGGIERWIAVAWGVGTFTRLACTLSTIIAGFYAAFLRKYMFENKKPGGFISLAIGVVMEVFHMMMVFLTNMDVPETAMKVVADNTVPMVIANAVSLMLAATILSILAGERLGFSRDRVRISQTIQRWLLLTVVLAFLVTSFFVFRLQDVIANTQAENELKLSVDDVARDVMDTSDRNLMNLTHDVAKRIKNNESIDKIAEKLDIAEISLIDLNGKIVESSEESYLGFDMYSGEQAIEFMNGLKANREYVQEYRATTSDTGVWRKYAGVEIPGGYLQVGYDSEQFQKDIDEQMQIITKNRHVGKNGYLLILDEKFDIVCAPNGSSIEKLFSEVGEMANPNPGEIFTMTVAGEPCFCCFKQTEGYYIMSVLPESEAFEMRNIALYVNTFLEILVFAVLFGLIYMLIKRVVVNQIKDINVSLSKITGGDLNEVVDVRSNAEFASLSDDINQTVDALKGYIAEASARIDKELEFAKSIQVSALPNTFPAFPKHKEFDIYASMVTAKEVGGDFYDFYITHDTTLNFLIADVSGKGIPAAMFMMRAKTELKTLTEADMAINDIFTHGNLALCEGNDAGMFVTAWQGCLDLKTGLVKFANAGHNPPLVRHAGGKFEYLKSRAGFVLAGMDSVKYRAQELQLEPGDTIYLYTDGVTEATNSSDELFGEERLIDVLNSKEFENVRDMCDFVKQKVDEFVGEAPQFDDITMVALKYFGEEMVPAMRYEEADISDIPKVTEFIEGELEKIEFPMKAITQISIAIDEIYSNIVNYGYRGKKGPVTVKLYTEDDNKTVKLMFIDEGIPYNPMIKDDPDTTLSAEERSIGGLGIFMVKKSMDDMSYRYENECNVLTITKKAVSSPSGQKHS